MEMATNSIGIESMTPERAADILRYNYRHNRPIRKNHVQYLLNEMKCGRFLSTAEVHVAFDRGVPNLINGQHTLSAIVLFGKPVKVTLRKSIVTENGQLAMVYAFGHDTGLRRTFTDAMGAYDVGGIVGLGSKHINKLASALRFIKRGFFHGGRSQGMDIAQSPADIVEDVYNWAGEMHIYIRALSGMQRNAVEGFLRQSTLSVALITLRYQPEKAIDFWSGAAKPDNIAYKDVRAGLRRMLDNSKSRPGSHLRDTATDVLARKCARWWSAFYANESLEMARVPMGKETAPIVIAGTPYNGNQSAGFLSISKGSYSIQ